MLNIACAGNYFPLGVRGDLTRNRRVDLDRDPWYSILGFRIWGWGTGYGCIIQVCITPIMKHQMEKQMENEMQTGILHGLALWGWPSEPWEGLVF